MNTPASNPLAGSPVIHDLTDEQWHRIVPLLPEMKDLGPRRGRPCIDIRCVVNGVLWVLRTGKAWKALPDRYPPYQTSHRYYLRWKRSGVLASIAFALFNSDVILTRQDSRKGDASAI